MADESVDENIYLATAFGYGGQKRFHKPPLAIAERYRQCAETSYADSDVKDDKGWTPRITLTNDTTSIDVSPTQQRSGFADN